MGSSDLLLDPAIRIWVFLPIIVITFLVGIVRHYVSILIASQKKITLQQVMDSQALIRSRFPPGEREVHPETGIPDAKSILQSGMVTTMA